MEGRPCRQMGLSRRVLLFLVGFTECCIFGGLVFGWPQLVLVLKQEGIYSDLCTSNDVLQNTSKILSKLAISSKQSQVPETFVDPSEQEYLEFGRTPCGAGNCSSSSTGSELTTFSTLPAHDEGDGNNSSLGQQERWRLWKDAKCGDLNSSAEESENGTSSQRRKEERPAPCPAQDARFALFFTIAVVSYSLPSVLVGYLLHYAGLWAARITGSLMIIASFICLGLVSPDRPHLLLPALVLLAMGGNQLRLCAVQLGDLFPARRATAITLLMGSYSVSSSIFFLFQVAADVGVSRPSLCWGLAGIGGASLLSTFAMPVRHISQPALSKNDTKGNAEALIPLGVSLWSASSLLHQYWLFAVLLALNSYQQTFNYWVTASSCTPSEVRTYTGFFSFCGLAGAFVAPVLGYLTDSIVGRAKQRATCSFSFRVEEVTANFIPLFVTSVCSFAMYSCLLVFKGSSIYTSLLCLIVCRSCIFSTSTAFLRARFPVQHLDRLLGIYGSVASVFLLVQFPHFVWAMNYYYYATCTALVLIGLNFTYPFHLLYKEGIKNALLQLPQPPGARAESWRLMANTK